MFTNQDFINYFEQLKNIEREMLRLANKILMNTSDPRIVRVVKKIHTDEVQHAKMISEIQDIFVKKHK